MHYNDLYMKKFVVGLAGGFILIGTLGAVWAFTQTKSGANEASLRMFMTLTDTRPENHEHLGPGNLPTNTITSAYSTDGYTFTFDKQNWLTSDDMSDPAISVNDKGVWVVASGSGTGSLRIASSQGCPSFPSFPEVFKNGGGIPDVVPFGDGFRIYYTNDRGIYSAYSADGKSFTDEGRIMSLPSGMSLVADPAVTQRADGTYVMYFKATTGIDDRTPYSHMIYRATSDDGLDWKVEDKKLIEHASVPATYTDANGRVWIYYLDFGHGWPQQRETVWVTYEQDDLTLAEPKAVIFEPTLPSYLWVNDPDPLLVPNSINLDSCQGI